MKQKNYQQKSEKQEFWDLWRPLRDKINKAPKNHLTVRMLKEIEIVVNGYSKR